MNVVLRGLLQSLEDKVRFHASSLMVIQEVQEWQTNASTKAEQLVYADLLGEYSEVANETVQEIEHIKQVIDAAYGRGTL